MEATIYWLTSLAALVGVWLNIHRHVGSFWIWSVTNAIWVYADATHGLWPQAALQAVYFVLSIYGIAKWKRADRARGDGSQGDEVPVRSGGSLEVDHGDDE